MESTLFLLPAAFFIFPPNEKSMKSLFYCICDSLLVSPLLIKLHRSVDGIAFAPSDVTLGSAPQKGFDCLHPSQTTGHMERGLPVVVQLIDP